MDVAVIGNSSVNAGFGVAADLAMAGHRVRLAAWPGEESTLEPLRRRGGIEIAGDIQQSTMRRGGLAKLRLCDRIAEAVTGAAIVVIDVPAAAFESRFAALVEHLEPEQIVHVNMHGYWPALRLAPLLRAAGKSAVTITEGPAPTVAATYSDGVLGLQWMRRKLPVAAFPANRFDAAFAKLQVLFPHIVPAASVIETGFAGLNMMVHFPLVLLNVGWCERAQSAGEDAPLYGPGVTDSVGRLAEAQDVERKAASAAYGVTWRGLGTSLKDYYAADGADVTAILRGTPYYQALAPYPAAVWRNWLAADVPHAHVPFVEIAERAGIAVPLHRAAVEMAGALLGRNFWRDGVTLERLGLGAAGVEEIKRYVVDGRPLPHPEN
jgi:opine dehydrogenase